MTTIRRITVSQIDGNSSNSTDINEIRPFGETAFYLDTDGNTDKLVLMMFDGTRTHLKSKVLSPGELYGSNADGGVSGNSLDTIKLIPDATLYSQDSNYYVAVDVTSEGWINLRGGGTLNSSPVDILLGGTQNYVKVSDAGDDVTIRTSLVGEGVLSYDWTFDNTGTLTFPNGNLTIGNTLGSPTIQAADGKSIGLISTGVGEAGAEIGSNLIWYDNVMTPTTLAAVVANNPLYVGAGDVGIITGDIIGGEGNTTNVWNFSADGSVTLPSGGVVRETIVTDNPTIELEPANADSIHQKLVIKGGVPPNYNYENSIGIALSAITATNGQTVTVDVYSGNANLTNGTFYWWVAETTAVSIDSGTVAINEFGSGTFTVEIADSNVQFRVYVGTVDGIVNSDTGVSLYVNANADASYHLHLTTGSLTDTSIFLGIDNHCVRTRSNGGIEVRTRDYDLSETESWLFDKDGKLTFPSGGAIEYVGMGWTGLTNGITNTPVTIAARDAETGEYRATVDLFRGNGDDSYVNISTYNPDILTGYQWEFRATGDMRFPDSTLQRTAWTGGRVVSVPASSTGQAGDLEGDIAFNGSYMYYCTTTYSAALTFDTVLTEDTNSSNVFYIAKTSVPGIPTTGWSITMTPLVPGQTYNIVSAVISGSSWAITTEPANATVGAGTAVRITRPSIPANHWKRIAWSGDTW